MTQEETCSGQNHDVYLSIVVRSQKIKHSTSSMIKGVLGQPNFSPQTNTTQLFPQINTNFNNLSSVKVNTNISSCVKLDEWDKFEFSVKKEQKVLNY